MNQYRQREMQTLVCFQGTNIWPNFIIEKITQLKELLKKEIAIKFVLLEKCKNIKAENEKLREIIGTKNFFDIKSQLKDVGCQVSIGSSCMANEANNKGSIGKYYKDMFPHHNQRIKNSGEFENGDNEFKNAACEQEINTDEFFNQEITPELVPKFENKYIFSRKKAITKPESCPRQRRRSRQDRVDPNAKKQSVLNELGPGTTIIVIQK